MSVIEREVQLGILKAETTKGSCLAFLREIKNMPTQDNKGGMKC